MSDLEDADGQAASPTLHSGEAVTDTSNSGSSKFSLDQMMQGLEDLQVSVNKRFDDLKNGTPALDKVPSELAQGRKLDALVEDMVVAGGKGLIVGGLAGLALVRRSSLRTTFATFGAGFGAGTAWSNK